MANVLVTGATGFIGTHLVEALVRRGCSVRALVRNRAQASAAALPVEVVEGCLEDRAAVDKAVAAADTVFHLAGCIAAKAKDDFRRVNVEGTDRLLAACADQSNPPSVVAISSLAAAGPSPPDRRHAETDPSRPISRYGKSKRRGELAAHRWADRVPITILRPPIVYGPGDRNTLQMFSSIRYGLHADPSRRGARFSLVYVETLINAMLLAADRGRRIGTSTDDPEFSGYYYVCNDETPTYAELGHKIARALGRRCLAVRVPRALGMTGAWLNERMNRLVGRPCIVNRDKVREATAGSWTCSGERATRELGLTSNISLDGGLCVTADWYRTHGWL